MRDFLDTAKLRVGNARKYLPAPSIAAGLTVGTPAAIVGVWLLNQWLPAPMPEYVQIAAGSLFTGVAAYCAQVLQLLLLKLRRV